MMCRRLVLLSLVVGGVSLQAPSVWAQDPIHKAGRGIVNVLTGWIEVPRQLQLGKQEDNPVNGIGMGLVRGVGLTVLRGGVGVYEMLTFPIPYPKKFTSPYEQMEMKDYAWE